MYFKKVEELFGAGIKSSTFFKFLQLMPQMRNIVGKIFHGIYTVRAFINIHLLSLVSKRELHERPDMWLFKRLHPIIEQRQQTPTSRVDLLKLMLQVVTDEKINVSKIYQPYDTSLRIQISLKKKNSFSEDALGEKNGVQQDFHTCLCDFYF
jgi:hypothetical protein